jgi:hypothetical protein
MYHIKLQPYCWFSVFVDGRLIGNAVDCQSIKPLVEGDGDETRFLTKALKDLPHLSSVSATRQTPEATLASLNKFCCEAGAEFFVYDSADVYSVSLGLDGALSKRF